MNYIVTHREGYEDSEVVASFTTLAGTLAFTMKMAQARAEEETEQLRLNHEARVADYRQRITDHGPDHVPDELTVRTSMPGDPPNPWDEMTLAERLEVIESRGPGTCQARPIEGQAGYTSGYEQWEITALESQD